MDKLEIPYYEKKKGTDLFAKGEYMGAIKAYSKVELKTLTLKIGFARNFIFSKRWKDQSARTVLEILRRNLSSS